jgi:phosphatidylinositol dimannoside acyltransferase
MPLPTGLLRGASRAAEAAADQATTFGYLSAWKVVRLLPERRARELFERVADGIYRRRGPGVLRLRGNLRRARPDLDDARLEDLTHAAVRSYLRYWCESFRLPAWPVDDVVRRTRTVDEHLLRDAYAKGRGVVVPLPHMANWDWAGAWACATGMPLWTVAERLRPERLYDEFVDYRTTLGMHILPLSGGGFALPRLEDWVRGGGLVCLLADRDLSRTGVEVELCGTPARMPRGPALLARRTGAPLVPVTLHYVGDELTLTLHEPVPHADGDEGLVRMMQGVADVFTGAIRAHPQDWHMMQKVFVEDLRPAP